MSNLALTSDTPTSLNIIKSENIFLYDDQGKRYIDLISGIAVNNLGHRNPAVMKAISKQLEKHLHVMVYGEYRQEPQEFLATLLSEQLPDKLSHSYFVNSGSEAVEVALKLSRRYTGRSGIIACKKGYHGSTCGALSIMGEDKFKVPFKPLIPDVSFIEFNNFDDLNKISKEAACVIIEPVQGEAGVRIPDDDYLNELRNACNQTDTLLIFDEVQTGFGRTGSLFAFQEFGVEPDILVLAKALGGGMPLGAVISAKKILDSFKSNPILGHITTFGGHPLSCAAAIANLQELLADGLIDSVKEKGTQFRQLLTHELIDEVRGIGLMMAVQLPSSQMTQKVIENCLERGLLTDWFLFADDCLRICPPLIIEARQIEEACVVILESIEEAE